MRHRRWLVGLAAAPVLYLALLVVLGFALRGYVTDKVRDRLELALDADVAIGDSSLSLLRGKLRLEDVRITRDHGGHVEVDVEEIDVKLAPLGWAAVDHGVRFAHIEDARMELSARGIYDLAERRKKLVPVAIDELDLYDARIIVMPTKLLPRLGRIELEIERAHTTGVSLRHGLSWLFRMQELHARVHAAGFTFGVQYGDEHLGISGGMFGATPLSIRFPLPQPGPDGYELETVLIFVKELSKAIASQVKDGVKEQVLDWVGDIF
jgi:hypothetical protein